ncbi:hypothetical protein [Teichococcus aestuarii]|nr:hypothetical protein [Pseudoroseomonas aestuarii]
MANNNQCLRAAMDPWCLVALDTGYEHLFGFAIQHAGTGGLSWVLSTPVVWIDAATGRAQTESGRRYTLGRAVTPEALPTLEARIAFALMVEPQLTDPLPLPPVPKDLPAARKWVVACKMARHLGVEPPPLKDEAAVAHFLGANMERYWRLRDGRRPS